MRYFAASIVSPNLFDIVPLEASPADNHDEQHMYYQIPIPNDESNGSIT